MGMENHKLTWTLTEGVIDHKSKRKIDKNTVFQAASISKFVFASVLLRYRQENNLDLDVDVNTLLKSWQLPKHEWSGAAPVSLRRLLSHSAGVTVHGFGGYKAGENIPSIIDVLEGTGAANSKSVLVDIKPGTINRYSGGGTTIAQLVLQDQSHTPLPTLANNLVFKPLKMKHSAYSQPLDEKLVNNAALPHRSSGQSIAEGPRIYPTLAASGLWTTPSDLLRLTSKILGSYQGIDESFLANKTATEMLTPQIESIGMGVSLELEQNIVTSFSHGGANEGFRAQLFVKTKTGDGIAIMTNSDNGSELINSVLSRVSKIYGWNEFKQIEKNATVMKPTLYQSAIGSYKITKPFISTLSLQAKGAQFNVNMGDFVKDEMFYVQNDTKLFSTSGMELNLHKNGAGEIESISFWGGINAKKVSDQ